MVRHRWLIGQVALLGVLAVLALPSSGAAFSGVPILLTANGPSPAVQTVPAGMYPLWINQDTVAHTVTLANGCSFQVAPAAFGQCTNGFSEVVGTYAYTVDGTTQASIVVTAEGRTLTLGAKSHRIDRGSVLRLHGKLAAGTAGPPVVQGPRQPVIVLARPDRHHPFHRIAVVTAKPHRAQNPGSAYSVWRLRVRPKARTIYIAEADSQPQAGQYWQQAWSRPFRARVGR
jgi:plastocyanin